MKEKLLEILLDCLLRLGYVSRQGHAEFTIILQNHRITDILFLDKEKFNK